MPTSGRRQTHRFPLHQLAVVADLLGVPDDELRPDHALAELSQRVVRQLLRLELVLLVHVQQELRDLALRRPRDEVGAVERDPLPLAGEEGLHPPREEGRLRRQVPEVAAPHERDGVAVLIVRLGRAGADTELVGVGGQRVEGRQREVRPGPVGPPGVNPGVQVTGRDLTRGLVALDRLVGAAALRAGRRRVERPDDERVQRVVAVLRLDRAGRRDGGDRHVHLGGVDTTGTVGDGVAEAEAAGEGRGRRARHGGSGGVAGGDARRGQVAEAHDDERVAIDVDVVDRDVHGDLRVLRSRERVIARVGIVVDRVHRDVDPHGVRHVAVRVAQSVREHIGPVVVLTRRVGDLVAGEGDRAVKRDRRAHDRGRRVAEVVVQRHVERDGRVLVGGDVVRHGHGNLVAHDVVVVERDGRAGVRTQVVRRHVRGAGDDRLVALVGHRVVDDLIAELHAALSVRDQDGRLSRTGEVDLPDDSVV